MSPHDGSRAESPGASRTGQSRTDINSRRSSLLRIAEISALILGVILIGLYLTAKADSLFASRSAIDRFNRARTIEVSKIQQEYAAPETVSSRPVDTTLWSEGRVEAFRQSLLVDLDLPLAVLKVPSLGLEVPVFDGTDEVILNRGAGRIESTALPGQPGNIGIAGHRDGFFRQLSDVSLGDTIIVETIGSSATYTIEDILVVEPSDVWVLDPTGSQTVTLVTCYPFYFIGSAPQRYIVRAALKSSDDTLTRSSHP